MCGFLTLLAGRPGSRRDRFDAALATLEHRGPDATRTWWSTDQRMALGHTRLSIIGLDDGDQPMSTEDGRVHAVVNGESRQEVSRGDHAEVCRTLEWIAVIVDRIASPEEPETREYG